MHETLWIIVAWLVIEQDKNYTPPPPPPVEEEYFDGWASFPEEEE